MQIWKFTTLWGTITALMTASAVIGNGSVIGVIVLNKTLRSPTFTLIVFLAISDFLLGSLHLSFVSLSWFQSHWLGSRPPRLYINISGAATIQPTEGSIRYDLWCDASAYFQDLFTYITSATTSLICIERCLALYFPLQYKVRANIEQTVKATLISWAVAVAISLHVPILMDGGTYIEQISQCAPLFRLAERAHIALQIRVIFQVTICVVLSTCCILTLRVVISYTMSDSTVWIVRRKKVVHTTITQLLIVLLAFVTWCPHAIVYILRTWFPDTVRLSRDEETNLRVIVWYFSYCSAAINPFVYAFRMPRFRRLLNMTGNNQGFYAGATKATVNGRKTATQYIHTPQ